MIAHNGGEILAGMNRVDEAIPYFEKALRLEPRLIISHLALARICWRRGDLGRAQAHYLAAAKLSPPRPRNCSRKFAALWITPASGRRPASRMPLKPLVRSPRKVRPPSLLPA